MNGVQEVASSNLAAPIGLSAVSVSGYREVAESANSALPEQSPEHFRKRLKLRASVVLPAHSPPPATQLNGLPATRSTGDTACSCVAPTARTPGAGTSHEACGWTNLTSGSVRGGRSGQLSEICRGTLCSSVPVWSAPNAIRWAGCTARRSARTVRSGITGSRIDQKNVF